MKGGVYRMLTVKKSFRRCSTLPSNPCAKVCDIPAITSRKDKNIFFMLFSSLFMVAKLGIFVSFVILTNL